MSEKKDLLNNNNDDKKTEPKARKPRTKKASSLEKVNLENNLSISTSKKETININLYNEVLSTLFNSLSNPIVRNEIKINKDILKYIELQISNLFYLETVLSKKLEDKKMTKELLQLTANITNLALSINKSPKKSKIEILEDRNLLIVTIVNSCNGIERETLEKIREVDKEDLLNLNNQISALNDFTSEDSQEEVKENETDFSLKQQTNNLEANNNLNQNLNNNNMANLSKLGILPQHPASNPNFYPYLSKPVIIPKLKKILAGMLITSNVFIIITMIISLFVKGNLPIDPEKPEVFALSQTNNWLVLFMTVVLYSSFAYIFIKPTKILREKYHTSFFMLGLLFFWLIVTVSYFFWQISDNYYINYFLAHLKADIENKQEHIQTIIKELKALPNFTVFKIFAIITSAVCILPLFITLILILMNPRLDRNKIIRANSEYQNAINAALNGKKYEIDPTLFDNDSSQKHQNKKRKKASFTGRF